MFFRLCMLVGLVLLYFMVFSVCVLLYLCHHDGEARFKNVFMFSATCASVPRLDACAWMHACTHAGDGGGLFIFFFMFLFLSLLLGFFCFFLLSSLSTERLTHPSTTYDDCKCWYWLMSSLLPLYVPSPAVRAARRGVIFPRGRIILRVHSTIDSNSTTLIYYISSVEYVCLFVPSFFILLLFNTHFHQLAPSINEHFSSKQYTNNTRTARPSAHPCALICQADTLDI